MILHKLVTVVHYSLCYYFVGLFTWVPVTTTWHVLGLRMEESASKYGR